jgi:hypothetical protein
MLNSTINNRKKDLEPIMQSVEELERLSKEISSYNVYNKYIKLRIWLHKLDGTYEELLSYLDQLDKEYDSGKIKNERFDPYLLKLSRLQALLKLKRFDEGLNLAESYLDEIDEDFMHWISVMKKYFLLALHAGHLEQANDVLLEVLSSKSFPALEETEKLEWNIFRSYMYFLTNNRKLVKKFDYDRFINEIPEYQKDLAGLNTAIIILQVVTNIDGDLKDLTRRLDAVDDYVGKFLNNSFGKRTKLICKLLNKVALHNRDLDTISQKSKYLEEKLETAEISSDIYADVEVFPYNKLWEIVVQRLVALKQTNM